MNQALLALTAWWRSLNGRDQRIVLLGVALALPMLAYLAIWQPISSAQDKARVAEQAMAQQLEEVRQLAAQLRDRPAGAASASSATTRLAPLPAIEQVAREFSLSEALKRREAEANSGVHVVFEGASADALLHMLEALALKHGLQVAVAQIDPVSPGRVNAQFSLKSAAP
jgi:type II secretory pathway component PulM